MSGLLHTSLITVTWNTGNLSETFLFRLSNPDISSYQYNDIIKIYEITVVPNRYANMAAGNYSLVQVYGAGLNLKVLNQYVQFPNSNNVGQLFFWFHTPTIKFDEPIICDEIEFANNWMVFMRNSTAFVSLTFQIIVKYQIHKFKKK